MSVGLERLTKEVERPELTERKYKAINTCYYNSPGACADKLGEYENIDVDPKHLAQIKRAFDILNHHLHFEMAVDDNVGCLFTRLFNDNICVIAWVEGKEYLDIFKSVFKYYEEKPIPINEAKLKELINERFKKEGKTLTKTEAIWKD